MLKLTKNLFIEKAKQIHNNKYDYSQVVYIDSKTKILIKCNICQNYFSQTPNSHLRGRGCPVCNNKLKGPKWDLNLFIQKANIIHNNKYDYSKSVYINNFSKIRIICKEHGEFFQKVNDHLNGHGCPSCAHVKPLTTKTFIERAKQIHGDKYDYSEVSYKNNRTKVCIICKKHGKFYQSPLHHINKVGCPKCNSSKGEAIIRVWLVTHNIIFEEQKRFKLCKDKRPLPFDFYIPSRNLCIEYDGNQHFTPIQFFGGANTYNRLLTHDFIKSEYCRKNNIILLRISFKDSIEDKLTCYLS